MEKDIYTKLIAIQQQLKVPKNQWNDYGKYHYRSCEDIVEAVKPLAHAQGLVLLLSDEIEIKGNRYYVKATATLTDGSKENTLQVSAYAREDESRKGMDGSQVTGSSSTYARKYALNGMFGIDDNKDADTNEHKKQQEAAAKKEAARKNKPVICPRCKKEVKAKKSSKGTIWTPDKLLEHYGGMCSECAKKQESEGAK